MKYSCASVTLSLQYFTKKDPDDLSMSGAYNDNGNGTTSWYDVTPGVECYVGDKALKIDREAKTVVSEAGRVRLAVCFLPPYSPQGLKKCRFCKWYATPPTY